MNRLFWVWLILIIGCSAPKQKSILKIAHRGLPSEYPEETFISYQKTLETDADYLEADIQRTKDSILICFHDNDLSRTTNIKDVFPERINDPISSFTLNELMLLDAGSWKNPQYKGAQILTLKKLIQLLKSSEKEVGLYLETKKANQFPGIEKDLYKLLYDNDFIGEFESGKSKLILQTFEKSSLPLLHKYFPSTPLCWLIYHEEEGLASLEETFVRSWLQFGKDNGATIIGPSIPGPPNNYPDLMTKDLLGLYKEYGYEIHPYTFTSTDELLKYKPFINGYFTDICNQ